jgi:predicted ester cyclase
MTKKTMTLFGRRAALSLLAPALVGTLAPPAAAGEAANRELITEYVEVCLNGSDDRCLDRYLPADKVSAIRKSEQLRRHYFPDLHYRVLEVVADGDRVVAMLEVTGHREGTGPEAGEGAETGETGEGRLEIREALFYSVRGGKLHDGKLVSDLMGVAKALGYVIEPPPEE